MINWKGKWHKCLTNFLGLVYLVRIFVALWGKEVVFVWLITSFWTKRRDHPVTPLPHRHLLIPNSSHLLFFCFLHPFSPVCSPLYHHRHFFILSNCFLSSIYRPSFKTTQILISHLNPFGSPPVVARIINNQHHPVPWRKHLLPSASCHLAQMHH